MSACAIKPPRFIDYNEVGELRHVVFDRGQHLHIMDFNII